MMRHIIEKITSVAFYAGMDACTSGINSGLMSHKNTIEEIAARLQQAGYKGLFWQMDSNLIESIWGHGAHKELLQEMVLKPKHSELVRLLASEVLYAKDAGYPPEDWKEPLAFIYARALTLSGKDERQVPPGNTWGFMYYNGNGGPNDYGPLGTHLMQTGVKAIPQLARLLDNSDILVYEGSEDATIGNGLQYRVKDAAAYYIGKLAGITVQFYQDYAKRDTEIEHLKQKIK